MRPLGDVSVRVTDSAGRVRSTKTDELGVHAFEWLPPETYRIDQDLPVGLRALSEGADKVLTVDLTDQNATRIGCRTDIRARPEKEISGMVADPHGRSGFMASQPLDANEQNLRRDEVEPEPQRPTPYWRRLPEMLEAQEPWRLQKRNVCPNYPGED
jgi:hypothetical protein